MGNMLRIFSRVLIVIFALSPSVSAHPGSGIAVDKRGQVYFLDTGSGLWKIDTHGRLSRISDKRFHWLALDDNDRFAAARLPEGSDAGMDWEISRAAAGPTVLTASDWPITISRDGYLYYPSGRAGDLKLMRTSPSGASTAFATFPATIKGQPLSYVNGLASGSNGFVYYTEDNAVRRISTNGAVSTVVVVEPLAAGPAIPGITKDSRPLLRGLVVDSLGVIYTAASGDGRVLKITRDGKITTLLQTQSPWSPTDVALFQSDIYVLEYFNTARDVRRDWLPRVRKISSDGKSTIIASVDQMPGAR